MTIDRSEDEAPTEVDVDLSSSASAEITIKPQMVVPVLGTHAPRAPSPSLLEEEDSTATDLRPVAHVAPVRPAMDSVDSVTDQTIDVPVELERHRNARGCRGTLVRDTGGDGNAFLIREG